MTPLQRAVFPNPMNFDISGTRKPRQPSSSPKADITDIANPNVSCLAMAATRACALPEAPSGMPESASPEKPPKPVSQTSPYTTSPAAIGARYAASRYPGFPGRKPISLRGRRKSSEATIAPKAGHHMRPRTSIPL